MPYTIRKRKCKQSSGKSGTHVLSYTDNKGKKHSNCHTSKSKAKKQIAAIEMDEASMKENNIHLLRSLIREFVIQEINQVKKSDEDDDGKAGTFADARVAKMMAGGMSREEVIEYVKSHPL
jgi:hypothetical protein